MIKKAQEVTRTPFVRGVAVYQMGGIVMQITGFASSVLYARVLGLKEYGASKHHLNSFVTTIESSDNMRYEQFDCLPPQSITQLSS
jgi:hypothetical protein